MFWKAKWYHTHLWNNFYRTPLWVILRAMFLKSKDHTHLWNNFASTYCFLFRFLFSVFVFVFFFRFCFVFFSRKCVTSCWLVDDSFCYGFFPEVCYFRLVGWWFVLLRFFPEVCYFRLVGWWFVFVTVFSGSVLLPVLLMMMQRSDWVLRHVTLKEGVVSCI